MVPHWRSNPQAWSKPTMAGRVIPGVVHLDSVELELRIQKNKASGADGGGTTIKGLELPEFVFNLLLETAEEHAAWDAMALRVFPLRKPDARNLVPVYHPSLARYGIGTCFVSKLKETPPRNGGPMAVRLVCQAVKKKDGATKKPQPTTEVPITDLPGAAPQAPDLRALVRPAYGVR